MPNVVFLEGAVAASPGSPNSLMDLIGYYGAADKFVGAMRLRITLDATPPAR